MNREIAPNIIDNSQGRELVRVIKDQLKKSKEAKFAIGYFFLSGFNLVKDDFPKDYENRPFLKIVMGNETTYPTKEELVEGYNLREIFKQRMIEDLQSEQLSDEEVSQLKTLRDFVSNNIIKVKLYDKSRLHAKLYLFLTNPKEPYGSSGLAAVGSSNFTSVGITRNKELNVLLTSRDEVNYLNNWFDSLWEESIEFREDLLKVIDLSGVLPNSPYPKIGKMVDPQTLFKYLVYKWFDGRVLNLYKKDVLMEFQLVGVVNAIEKINFYNGVILADSVGLGKSFITAAIIEELLEGRHPNWVPKGKTSSIMLILPPSIISQWEELLIKSSYFLTDKITEVKKEEHNFKVYSIHNPQEQKHLGNLAFLSLGIFQNLTEEELKKIAKEYDFYVIDEAHKYRNSSTNRWKNARKLQKKEDGFANKFLLLTATPLNNSINDIYNLIRIFTDDAFTPFYVKGIPINNLMKEYKNLKRRLQKENGDDIKKELKKIATEIKQNVLDEIMILRTRKYITEQLQDLKIDDKNITFHDPKPYTLNYYSFYTKEYKTFIETVSNNLDKILFEHTKLYGTRFVVFEEEAVEGEESIKRLIEVADLFKLILGKRLESGIYSFETTLRRLYEKEKIIYECFNSKEIFSTKKELVNLIKKAVEKARIDKELDEIEEEYSIEEEREETWFDRVEKLLLEYAKEEEIPGKQYSEIELLQLGLGKVLRNLWNDLKLMDCIFNELDKLKELNTKGQYKTVGYVPKESEDITKIPIYSYKNEPKLESLKQMIANPFFKSLELENIPSLNRKKILIFTQYKDTAYYIYTNLIDWIEQELDLHSWLKDKDKIKVALVTGDTDIATKINYMKRFSPRANDGWEEVKKYGEIEILISTDALSEGVNLQDANAVVNYDLPWNPMTIVQRVGRVNRIGNEKDIDVINYVPSDEIEVIVGVLQKLKQKIQDITLVVGKDVKILSPDEEISIETFGERIKDISSKTVSELEEYGISQDFKEFIPEGMPKEQIDEYKLLNLIQYDFAYKEQDFIEVSKMNDGPYYSYIEGNNKVVSIYEFYRGKYKIMKKVMCISENGKIEYKTPLEFINLLTHRKVQSQKIDKAIENLKSMKEETEKITEILNKSSNQEQKGFLNNLFNALLVEREKAKDIESEFYVVMNTLKNIPYYLYTKEIKKILAENEFIEVNKDTIIIKDYKSTVENLYSFFKNQGLTEVESLKITVNHLGWFYEI